LAEQFKRTYISATEFIDSWEKEIYELTYLDYFSFLLINELASSVEREFFANQKKDENLQLDADEISTLAFNIVDGLQTFLEKNCFGSCKLNCPCKLDDQVETEDRVCSRMLNTEIKILTDASQTKENCLSSDILNYVVLDSMLDFYNYEMGIVLNEGDNHLVDFADFILNKILQFIRNKGQRFLNTPNENASKFFNDIIQIDEDSWQDKGSDLDPEEEEEFEPEPWKLAYSGIENALSEFSENYEESSPNAFEIRVIKKFKEYLVDFVEIKKVEDITMDDIEEFLSVVLPHEMLMEDIPCFDAVSDLFTKILTFFEFNHNLYLKIPFEKFVENELTEIIRTFKITHSYQKRYPLLDFLMSPDSNDKSLVEGFFEVHGKVDQAYVLKDIHLKTKIEPVDFKKFNGFKLKAGDILHLHLVIKEPGWQIAHLEMVYPSISKYYLY